MLGLNYGLFFIDDIARVIGFVADFGVEYCAID